MGRPKEDIFSQLDFDPSTILVKTGSRLNSNEACYVYILARRTFRSGTMVHVGNSDAGALCCQAEAAKISGGKLIVTEEFRKQGDVQHEKLVESTRPTFESTISELNLEMNISFRERGSHNVWSDTEAEIDLVFINLPNDREGIVKEITYWKRHARVGGVIVLKNADEGAHADETIDEAIHMDPAFLEVGAVGRIRAFRKHTGKLEMILCSGLQSGGTTLISWCFLQRPDMDGILDMWNEDIELMPYIETALGWCKMTISCFRWNDIADFFLDQGWAVKPLLVVRDVREVYASLRKKPYGLNGLTAEDPPLRMRFKRFLRDWEKFRKNGWPIIRFESFLHNPETILQECCKQLEIPWFDEMVNWPKPAGQILGVSFGNETFRNTLSSKGLRESIVLRRDSIDLQDVSKEDLDWLENTFHSYNKANDYPLHIRSDNLKLLADRPTFFVTTRHKNKEKIEELQRMLARSNAELASCNTEITSYKNVIKEMRESKSWRLTALLRKMLDYWNHLSKKGSGSTRVDS